MGIPAGQADAIEITPEMLECGATVLVESGYLGENHLFVDDSIIHLVRNVLSSCLDVSNHPKIGSTPAEA